MEGKTIVLMVARLLIHKGIIEYCQAARMIKEKTQYMNQVEFLLAGDVDKGNPFSVGEDSLNYYIDNKFIKFLGWRTDIRELIALCGIFILPSYREGIPRTLIEAASMGKPLIAADSVGCREVVDHGKNGYLVPVKNHAALGEAIERLINDRHAQKAYGEHSRAKAVKEFDDKIVLEKTIRLYSKLAKNKGFSLKVR
jgi:N,N'-diacetylbacillosaminyl-diphospho-undecaprenol alpha-1,3-N-acetylgalactosaminyltransferase